MNKLIKNLSILFVTCFLASCGYRDYEATTSGTVIAVQRYESGCNAIVLKMDNPNDVLYPNVTVFVRREQMSFAQMSEFANKHVVVTAIHRAYNFDDCGTLVLVKIKDKKEE